MRKKSNWGKLRTQRGGFAPYETSGSGHLLDQATMVQAQSDGQVFAINEAQTFARQASQTGGSRKTRQRNRSRQSRRNRSRQSRRNQRGGNHELAAYGPAGDLRTPAGANMGMNPQFDNEQFVNPLYGHRGAQGY